MQMPARRQNLISTSLSLTLLSRYARIFPAPAKKMSALALTVKLEVVFNADQAVDAAQPVWRERRIGKVSRALKFGQPIDGDGAIAKQEHGVLTLTLPKKGSVQIKRVTIQ
jgi:HSP20 family molecular chaperone IbpA